MQGYFAIITLILIILFVLLRSFQLKKHGTKALLFGEIDKKDFIIPPFMLVYFYLIIANTFNLPRLGNILTISVIASWIGVVLCVLALILFLWGIISFGKSFRVGIDIFKHGKLITTGAFSISRNPLYVAFFYNINRNLFNFSYMDIFCLFCCRTMAY